MKCSVLICTSPSKSLGLCPAHRRRLQLGNLRPGDPLDQRVPAWRVDVIDPRTGYRMWTVAHCTAGWRADSLAWVIARRLGLAAAIHGPVTA